MDAKGLRELYNTWLANKHAEGIAKEADPTRLGKFRGGSVGCVGPKGEIYGTCPRKCLARSWGHNGAEQEPGKYLMFDGGLGNEDLWDARFKNVLGGDPVIPEGDPRSVVNWSLDSGRNISGSPDGILEEVIKKEEVKTLIEYKRISSAWTARKVSIKRIPKKMHVIQMAHYMAVSNLPNGLLIYTQDVNFSCPNTPLFAKNLDPDAYKEALMEQWCGYWPDSSDIVKYRGGVPDHTIPHVSIFDVMIDVDSVIWYKHEDGEWVQTMITTGGIKEFYNRTDKQEIDGVLEKKPTRKSCVGDKPDNASECEYCDLAPICKDKNLGYDEFKRQVTTLMEK